MAAFPILQALSPGIPAVPSGPVPGSPGEGFGVEMSARRAWPPPGAPPPGTPQAGPEGGEATTFEPNALSKQPDFLLLDPAKSPSFFSDDDLVETIPSPETRPFFRGDREASGHDKSVPTPVSVLAASVLMPVPQVDFGLVADLAPVQPDLRETGSRPVLGVAGEAVDVHPAPEVDRSLPTRDPGRLMATAAPTSGGVDPTLDRAGTAKALVENTLSRPSPDEPRFVDQGSRPSSRTHVPSGPVPETSAPYDGQRPAPAVDTKSPTAPAVDPTLDRVGSAHAAGKIARQATGSRPASVSDYAPPASRGEVLLRVEAGIPRTPVESGEPARPAGEGGRNFVEAPKVAGSDAPKTTGPMTIQSRAAVPTPTPDGAKVAVASETNSARSQTESTKKLEADPGLVPQKSNATGSTGVATDASGQQSDAGLAGSESSEDGAFVPSERPASSVETDRADPFATRVVEATAARAADGLNRADLLSPRLSLEVIAQIADRVEMLAAKSARREVVVHLEPEELGSVTMVVRRNGTQVEASVYASHEQVRTAIDQNRAGLSQQLESRGLTLGGLTVGSQSAEGRSPNDGSSLAFSHPSHPNFGAGSSGTSARSAVTIEQIRASIRKDSGLDLWT